MFSRAHLPRLLWSLVAAGAFALAAASLLLSAWLDLHPCHLCIFQRLLYMLLALLGLLAALKAGTRLGMLAGGLVLATAAAGAATAAYQSWLQMQPAGSISCMAGEPGLIERLVEWLGQQWPTLFLATGFCEDTELMVLGLSLANWSLIFFLACLGAAAWALRPSARASLHR
ncbi:MAG: disulfide bond formation protein DsbB [bacterium]|nr:MAG: disulfide bond formation protein DsbB [bacterium]KAF0150033.1 MAG: disulfide bond formation protein DsbB [bacterium]KAF0169141.1 MAG: disulfide bond formation protein DsbB [bacterium]TXT21452.1 MAG: disulfide bond formation protein DsbB [bacterium]